MLKGKKIYLTKEGLKEIKKEYEKCKRIKKSKSKGGVPSAMHSEEMNADFIAFQEDLQFLESRLEELEYILKNYELIEKPSSKEKQGMVNLGARVKVEVNGEEDEFVIVGTVEANPSEGKISNESPVGKALLGAKEGEEVKVQSPTKTTFKIKKIKY